MCRLSLDADRKPQANPWRGNPDRRSDPDSNTPLPTRDSRQTAECRSNSVQIRAGLWQGSVYWPARTAGSEGIIIDKWLSGTREIMRVNATKYDLEFHGAEMRRSGQRTHRPEPFAPLPQHHTQRPQFSPPRPTRPFRKCLRPSCKTTRSGASMTGASRYRRAKFRCRLRVGCPTGRTQRTPNFRQCPPSREIFFDAREPKGEGPKLCNRVPGRHSTLQEGPRHGRGGAHGPLQQLSWPSRHPGNWVMPAGQPRITGIDDIGTDWPASGSAILTCCLRPFTHSSRLAM